MQKLNSISFEKDVRTWKAGESIEFRKGITALVGVNGCGKSTILELLRMHFGIKDQTYMKGQDLKDCGAVIKTSEEKFDVKYYDFHGDDKKYAQSFGDDMMGQIHSMRASSGIGTLIQFDRTGIKNTTDSLIILDEPCRGLAQRVQKDMAGLIHRMRILGGNQVVLSTHSLHMMEVADNIYSVEHKKYFDTVDDFMKEHLRENERAGTK